MGHHAAEMMCDTYGNVRCTCPLPEDATLHYWVVGDNFTVMTVKELLASVHPVARTHARVMTKRYAHRSAAEKAARVECEAAVEAARAHLTKLKNILKVQRPWEQK